MREEVSFPSPVAAKLTGVTDGTLEHWTERAFLKPSVRERGRGGRKAPRLYSFRDLVAIRVVAQLRERGLDVRHLHGVVAYVRSREGLDLDRDFPPRRLLITDGVQFVEVEKYADLDRPVTRRGAQGSQHPKVVPSVLLFVRFGELVTELQREARALRAAA